ncbi:MULTISPECIES: TraX family protein [unclassified Lactobacillus]|uniref:TraX family protein n=1 Tax=unclassified Lactobacillus TaxID=2620435 RepID=UPI000BEEF434|nr:hypothetical protein CP365_00880 [Lactobacillus sp. UMNPBX14]PEH03191.1 hypothetical protein CP357_01190 [Lactobacillus sp. UMNPBX6]
MILGIFSLPFEGGLYLLPVLLIFYFAYHKLTVESIGIFIWCFLILIKAIHNAQVANISLYSSLTFDSEWMMIAVIPFILLYNGKRGKKSLLTKFFFYIVYPAHLWILMMLKYCLLG